MAEKKNTQLDNKKTAENDEKKKALEVALAQIEKQFGKGSVMKLGETATMAVEAIPTGALSLDIALGIGGVPRGRIIEVYGPESSGKTTVALHMIAEAQKMGGEAAFIDAEHALDPVYAKKLGVDIENLIVSQPDTGEHVGLNKCNQHFHTIHEDAEQHRHDTHGRADDCPHTGGHEHNAGQCQDDGVSRHDVGKQTDHQGKGLGENAEQLDGWHDGHRALQPHGHFRPKDFLPILLGTEYIDRNECTECQYQGNGYIAGHIASSREDGN